MRRTRVGWSLVVGAVLAGLVLAGCGEQDGGTTAPPGDADEAVPDDDLEQVDPDAPEAFDRDGARERAESLLGLREDEVEESESVRIMRRGDEQLPGTMDLRPGRLNLELDEVDGEYRVTRIVVEVPDGEDELVVE